jgi:signal transduction histidine kinase
VPAVKVHADRKRLLQVMTNLLSNAAKFSPEGDRRGHHGKARMASCASV